MDDDLNGNCNHSAIEPRSVVHLANEGTWSATERVLILMHVTGIRRGNLCRLKLGDIDAAKGTITYRTLRRLTIRKRPFHTPMSIDLWPLLEKQLAELKEGKLGTIKK